MYLVELFERGKGTSFVARKHSLSDAYHVAHEDAQDCFGANLEGIFITIDTPRYDGCVATYRVVGREIWYSVYLAEVVEG